MLTKKGKTTTFLMIGLGAALLTAGVARASSFDGTWNVTLVCPPEAGGREYTIRYKAEVKNGTLHGRYGSEDKPGSQTLDGNIAPDGTALFTATGVIGNPDAAMKYRNQGRPYTYKVDARFDGNQGSGMRQGDRPCTFTFVRR